MLNNNRQSLALNFAGHEFLLLASGGCYWPVKKTLIVSDLHLEKGSYFALRGQPLPIADTRCTLERLQQEIVRLEPETVICLGDNIHDAHGLMRMKEEDLSLLQSLCSRVVNWQWVMGNHDKLCLKKDLANKMQFVSEVNVDNVCFTHELQDSNLIQIIGHYHPKISIKMHGVKISGKCFSVTPERIIMPAFGSYTGGLDINDKVYNKVLNGPTQYYLLHRDNIFLVRGLP